MKYRGSNDTVTELLSFFNIYGAPPYILNIYGEYGIGKTTIVMNTINTIANDIDLVDVSEKFNQNPKKFFSAVNGIKPTLSFNGKKLVYFIRYPSMNKYKYDVLSKLMIPTIVISSEKLYRLNDSATYVKHPKPNYQMFKSALLKYISERGYTRPKPSIINKILSMSENYVDMYSLVDNLQPDYDMSKLIKSENTQHYDDFTLLTHFFKGNSIPYHKLLNPKLKDMILYTIVYAYNNIDIMQSILEKLAFIDANSKQLTGDIQQLLVDTLISISPSNTRIYRYKPSPSMIPRVLLNYASTIAPDNPLYVLDLMTQLKYIPPDVVISRKELYEINKFYKSSLSVQDIFRVEDYSDIII